MQNVIGQIEHLRYSLNRIFKGDLALYDDVIDASSIYVDEYILVCTTISVFFLLKCNRAQARGISNICIITFISMIMVLIRP